MRSDNIVSRNVRKAHATSYALVANATQYLKVKYPLEFFCSLLSQATDDEYEGIKAVSEKYYGIKYHMPDINLSKVNFSINDDEIVWPFTSIKGIGISAANEIVKHQPYDSFKHIYETVNKRIVNVKIFRLLITTNSLNEFSKRNKLIKRFYKLHKINETFEPLKKKQWDFEASKVMPYFKQSVEELFPDQLKGVIPYEKFSLARTGQRIVVAGIVSSVRYINSKRGKMAILNLSNIGDTYNIVLWSDMIAKLDKKDITIKVDMPLKISGFKSMSRMNEPQIALGNEPEAYIKVLK